MTKRICVCLYSVKHNNSLTAWERVIKTDYDHKFQSKTPKNPKLFNEYLKKVSYLVGLVVLISLPLPPLLSLSRPSHPSLPRNLIIVDLNLNDFILKVNRFYIAKFLGEFETILIQDVNTYLQNNFKTEKYIYGVIILKWTQPQSKIYTYVQSGFHYSIQNKIFQS